MPVQFNATDFRINGFDATDYVTAFRVNTADWTPSAYADSATIQQGLTYDWWHAITTTWIQRAEAYQTYYTTRPYQQYPITDTFYASLDYGVVESPAVTQEEADRRLAATRAEQHKAAIQRKKAKKKGRKLLLEVLTEDRKSTRLNSSHSQI